MYPIYSISHNQSCFIYFQCRIKLKNLKSQYRYVKDRIPNIDDLDLEEDEVVKELIAKCQVHPGWVRALKRECRMYYTCLGIKA